MTGWVNEEKIEVERKYECLAFSLFSFFFLQKMKEKKMECEVQERTEVEG